MKPDMQKRLTDIVRRRIVSKPSKSLRDALSGYGVHFTGPSSPPIPQAIIDRIKADLLYYGVKPEQFENHEDDGRGKPDRVQCLEFGNNEKAGAQRVNEGRVLIKSFPGQVIDTLSGSMSHLPGMNFEVHISHASHLCVCGVLLVENKIVFDRIHDLQFEVPDFMKKYLVVFRGTKGAARQDYCEAFLRALGVPVWVFPDYDPSGIANAIRVPLYAGILWPGAERLEEAFDRSGCREKYETQIPGARSRLETSTGDAGLIWKLMRRRGQGLVQEEFLRKTEGREYG